jgi:cell division protein ZapE
VTPSRNSPALPQSPLEHYRALADTGELKPDDAQWRAAAALDALYRKLKNYRPRRRRLFNLGGNDAQNEIKGIYLYGDVGRGKSFLMDLFFAGVAVAKKRRVHFNAFMAETHQRIHEWRTLSEDEREARDEFVRDAGDDPIAPVAKRITAEASLLAFDEFQVSDVADAMILGRLFEKLFASGVVVVATSNTPPQRLYEGGLNRGLFLPFIAMIEEKMQVIELDGGRDYRLDRMGELNVYITPLGPEADAAMDAAWQRLTDAKRGVPTTMTVLQRKLVVPQTSNGVARFTFDALCREPLGAADYVALAKAFHTIMIDRIPRFASEDVNAARRFTLLIDTLYDERVKVVCSAADSPSDLCSECEDADWFKRTSSRLMEMQSAQYLRAGHGTRELMSAN